MPLARHRLDLKRHVRVSGCAAAHGHCKEGQGRERGEAARREDERCEILLKRVVVLPAIMLYYKLAPFMAFQTGLVILDRYEGDFLKDADFLRMRLVSLAKPTAQSCEYLVDIGGANTIYPVRRVPRYRQVH